MGKQTKKLTRRQKEILTKKHTDATLYRLVKEDAYTFTVVDKNGNEKVFNY